MKIRTVDFKYITFDDLDYESKLHFKNLVTDF
jgi:hypothetical protein